VGDGTTSNTAAFRSAVDHLSQYSGEEGGGAMLYVPAGKWLTGPFNLTSHFTLFLHRDAVILASQVRSTNTIFGFGLLSIFFIYMMITDKADVSSISVRYCYFFMTIT
jgi:hypothetical protein